MTAQTLTPEKTAIRIKCRGANGAWSPATDITGLTLRQIFSKLDGSETVCEYTRADKTWYFCGTDHWRKAMKKRGTAVLFGDAVDLLESVNPAWLNEIPVTAEMAATMTRLGAVEAQLFEFGVGPAP